MSRHRVDMGLRGMRYSFDGRLVDATGFPLWQSELPRGLHLERRAEGSPNNNRQFVRTPGCGVTVEWTSNRNNRGAAAQRDERPPPRQQRGPPPGHQRGPPPGHQQGPPPEHVRAHPARQRRERHPERRRGEQRGRDRGPDTEEVGQEPRLDPGLFDVSEYSSDDGEDGDEGSRAPSIRDDYGCADNPRRHGRRVDECDLYHIDPHHARSPARPRRDDHRSAQDPHFFGLRVQLRQPPRGRGH